ncbi:MAG: DUF362 domain-containing protein [Candidatus Thorarchaeota archaeon]|nr:DUF362 domain-containing protein [Candidatus Thorarchaeota archaeon]
MVSTSYVAVAVKRNPRESLNSAIARMPQPIPFSPDADRVLVKPSIYDPSLPGNTSLQMMSAVVAFFRGVTPISIIESDNPVRTTEEAFEKSGYAALVGENIELFNLSNDKQHLTRFAGNGMQEEHVAELLQNHKFLVNVATLKLQKITSFGAGIKNLFGLLGRQDKNVLHSNIDGVLLDLLIQFRPNLSIIDLTEVVIGNRKDKRTIPLGGVIVGIDPVAVDAYCAHLLGFDPLKIKYIQRAFEAGLGEALPERIQVLGTEHQIQKITDAIRF